MGCSAKWYGDKDLLRMVLQAGGIRVPGNSGHHKYRLPKTNVLVVLTKHKRPSWHEQKTVLHAVERELACTTEMSTKREGC